MNLERRLFCLAAATAPLAVLAEPSQTVASAIASKGADAAFAWVRQQAREGQPYAAGYLKLARRAGVASCLLSACNDLGLRTLGDVQRYAEVCSDSYAQVQGLFPAVDLDMSILTPYSTILTAATQQFTLSRAGDAGTTANGGKSDAFKDDAANGSFVRLPRGKIFEAAQKFPRRDADYWRVRLCEAKARSLRVWFDDQGYGNAAVGVAGLFLYNAFGQFLRGHEVAVIAEDNPACTLWVVDGPANPAGFCKFPGNADAASCKLARFYW